jgi:hypothetical protein
LSAPRSTAATSLALEGLVSPLAGLEDLWDAPIAWDDPPARWLQASQTGQQPVR